MVTDKERDYMYQMYVVDPRARVNVGIRRRLAPLMDNEIDKIKLMNSLLLSMPGSPSLYYGDEIGMGDNFFLGDRNGVRTPMQWSPDRNAGFSRADPQRLYLPPIMDPVYGFGSVNVEAQQRERGSLLNWMQRVLALRKNHQAFGRGELVFLHPRNRKILAYFRLYQDDIILCVANLSRAAQAVELDLSAYKGRVPVELMGRASFPPIGELPYLLTLPGHNHYWFRLASGEEAPVWHDEHLLPEELPTLVLFDGWNSFFNDRVIPSRIAIAEKVRHQLEEEVLPHFVATQHWSGAKYDVLRRVVINDYAEWGSDGKKWLIALCSVEGDLGVPYSCFLPLALAWENGDEKHLRAMLPTTVAKVRQQAQIGILADAFADEWFCQALAEAIRSRETLTCATGTIRFSPTDAFVSLSKASATLSIRSLGLQGSNTTVVLAEQYFLKGYRHLEIGIHPEFEMGRFLTEVVKFPNIAPVFGLVEYEDSEGRKMTLALLQGYVRNQGDCWNYTLDYLGRFLEECRTAGEPPKPAEQAHAAYLVLIRTLGQRTGELHNALGKITGDSAFDPEPVNDSDLSNWIQHGQAEAQRTLNLLKSRELELAVSVVELAQTLLARRNALAERLQACISGSGQLKLVKTRYHGNYHLGHVLLAHNDFVITDFKGDPTCTFVERHHKHSSLRDVADMLRSFSYAAHTALAHASAEQPKNMSKFEPFVREWEAEVSRVFLAAYMETVGNSLVAPDAPLRDLLDLFILEKALYDVRNALDKRPDWVVIPLRCILSRLQSVI
jgi:maltose alpha-D-glucosyltransferase/alpha-amylase